MIYVALIVLVIMFFGLYVHEVQKHNATRAAYRIQHSVLRMENEDLRKKLRRISK